MSTSVSVRILERGDREMDHDSDIQIIMILTPTRAATIRQLNLFVLSWEIFYFSCINVSSFLNLSECCFFLLYGSYWIVELLVEKGK